MWGVHQKNTGKEQRMSGRIKTVKGKIILFFVLLAVFQNSVMLIFAKLHLEPSIVDMYFEHLNRSTDIALEKTVEEIRKIEKYTVNMIGDEDIQNFLKVANNQGKTTSIGSITQTLRNKILAYIDYDNIIQGIYLLDYEGNIYSNQDQGKMYDFIEKNAFLKNRKDASAVWYTEENAIVLYRIVNNSTTDLTQKIGALCVFIDRELFEDRINDLMMEENQHYLMEGSEGKFSLTSDADTVLGEEDIVSIKEIQGWKLKTWIEKETAYAPVDVLLRILMLELFMLLIVSVGLTIFLSWRITRPMKKIERAMREIGQGNMDIVVYAQDEDEMGVLAATLNSMSTNIKELMTQIHKDEEQKRYLELKAMQYQVNPHFLYNTLDSIAMSARKNQDFTSEKMTLALSDFFRTSLSSGMEYVTVAEEIHYVQSYLEIQSMRFPDVMTWECTIENGIEEEIVLKFILQPLVENSLYHGLRDSGRRGHINVRAYAEDNDIILCVVDNGVGMLPDQIEQLREEINQKHISGKKACEGGFGLQNVQQRLHLVYGQKAGIVIESEWDEGTSITVTIPNGRKKKDEESGDNWTEKHKNT